MPPLISSLFTRLFGGAGEHRVSRNGDVGAGRGGGAGHRSRIDPGADPHLQPKDYRVLAGFSDPPTPFMVFVGACVAGSVFDICGYRVLACHSEQL